MLESLEAPVRRKLTMILTDDLEFDKLKIARERDETPGSDSTQTPAPATPTPQPPAAPAAPAALPQPVPPTEIRWSGGGEKVYVTGLFTGWRKMVGLIRQPDGSFSIRLNLPVGTHRFRFVVDNELRFSDDLPLATDQMGNFVNYIEVVAPGPPPLTPDEQSLKPVHQQPLTPNLSEPKKKKVARPADLSLGLRDDDDDMGGGYSRYHDVKPLLLEQTFTSAIPEVFVDPGAMENYYQQLDQQRAREGGSGGQSKPWLIPPQLPPHLENVVLNNYQMNDSQNIAGALPIPNHVVLNHLATTSIKHKTLAVASVIRYKQKYMTQVLYAPLE